MLVPHSNIIVGRPKMSLSGPRTPYLLSQLADHKLKKRATQNEKAIPWSLRSQCECLVSGIITRCNTASVLHGRGQLLRHRIFLTLVTCFSHDTNSSQSPKTSQNIYVRDRDWFIMSRKCVSFWWKYSSSSSKLFDLLRNPPANFFSLFPIVKLSELSECYWVSVFLRD